MSATTTTILIIAAVAIVSLIALAGLGFTSSSKTVDIVADIPDHSVDELPTDSSSGFVTQSVETEGPWFEAFGIALGASKYEAFVMFIPPADCAIPEDGRQLKAEGGCAGIPAEGEVSGGGTRGDASRLVIVGVPISEACHRELTPGDRWPAAIEACRAD
ncbi:MAG: hypothetical protein ACSLFM_07585 [Tepidiformaceae bacterium]